MLKMLKMMVLMIQGKLVYHDLYGIVEHMVDSSNRGGRRVISWFTIVEIRRKVD